MSLKRVPPEKQKAKVEEIVAELQSHPNPENERKLAIYDYIKPFYRASREDVFRFLACRQIKHIRECPVAGHYSRLLCLRPCHQRFYCMGCALWRIQHELVSRWEQSIKSALPLSTLILGPMIQLRWPMPARDQSSLTDSLPDKFREYIKSTLIDKIGHIAGILSPEWALLTHYDVILQEIRGLYLGPPFDAKLLKTGEGFDSPSYRRIYSTSSLTRGVENRTKNLIDNSSPWQPEHVKSTYLLDARDKNPEDSANRFWDRVRTGLQWVAGDVVALMELEPPEVYLLERVYRERSLTTSRGWIYGQRQTVIEPNPVLYVERKMVVGQPEMMEISPHKLIGGVYEIGSGSGSGSGEDGKHCPKCGKALQDLEDVEVKGHHRKQGKPPVQ